MRRRPARLLVLLVALGLLPGGGALTPSAGSIADVSTPVWVAAACATA